MKVGPQEQSTGPRPKDGGAGWRRTYLVLVMWWLARNGHYAAEAAHPKPSLQLIACRQRHTCIDDSVLLAHLHVAGRARARFLLWSDGCINAHDPRMEKEMERWRIGGKRAGHVPVQEEGVDSHTTAVVRSRRCRCVTSCFELLLLLSSAVGRKERARAVAPDLSFMPQRSNLLLGSLGCSSAFDDGTRVGTVYS